MNERFKQLSLLAGGSHYPTINPDMQQRFGELIVEHIVRKIEQEAEIAWAHEQGYTHAALLALSLEILEDFDMELDLDEEMDEE
jgi:hypothetical protein